MKKGGLLQGISLRILTTGSNAQRGEVTGLAGTLAAGRWTGHEGGGGNTTLAPARCARLPVLARRDRN